MQAISTAQEYGPQAIQYAQEYGPQAISAWQNYGPQAIQYAQEYGPQAISYAQNYGPQAIQYAQEYGPQAIQAWQQYGNQLPEAITFAQENAQYIPQVRGGHHRMFVSMLEVIWSNTVHSRQSNTFLSSRNSLETRDKREIWWK